MKSQMYMFELYCGIDYYRGNATIINNTIYVVFRRGKSNKGNHVPIDNARVGWKYFRVAAIAVTL